MTVNLLACSMSFTNSQQNPKTLITQHLIVKIFLSFNTATYAWHIHHLCITQFKYF